jgi:hypothetical protein
VFPGFRELTDLAWGKYATMSLRFAYPLLLEDVLIFLRRQHSCCNVIRANMLSDELLLILACTRIFCSTAKWSHDNNLFSQISGSLHALIQFIRTRTSTKHGPQRKHCILKLPYMRCLGNVFINALRLFRNLRGGHVCNTDGRVLQSVSTLMVICIPSFIKIRLDIQKLLEGIFIQTHRHIGSKVTS